MTFIILIKGIWFTAQRLSFVAESTAKQLSAQLEASSISTRHQQATFRWGKGSLWPKLQWKNSSLIRNIGQRSLTKIWELRLQIKNTYLLSSTLTKRTARWPSIFPNISKNGKLLTDLRITELRRPNQRIKVGKLWSLYRHTH